MLKRGFRKDAQIFFEVLVGHPLRPGKPSQLDDAFRLKMISIPLCDLGDLLFMYEIPYGAMTPRASNQRNG